MNTDRELLELAAKAAGLPMCEEWDCAADGDGILIGAGNGDLKPWNPLTDDGDALRLAVGCCLPLEVEDCQTCIYPLGVVEPHGDDPCAATRRAIVRAAAVIGGGQ